VLGVDPAARDTVFDYKVLDKVSRIKKMAGGLECGVDGGVTLDNLDAVIEAGPDFICAGSAIFGSSEPGKALAEFSRRISAAVG
jgi:ribulose-phosphate 3-epimerase